MQSDDTLVEHHKQNNTSSLVENESSSARNSLGELEGDKEAKNI